MPQRRQARRRWAARTASRPPSVCSVTAGGRHPAVRRIHRPQRPASPFSRWMLTTSKPRPSGIRPQDHGELSYVVQLGAPGPVAEVIDLASVDRRPDEGEWHGEGDDGDRRTWRCRRGSARRGRRARASGCVPGSSRRVAPTRCRGASMPSVPVGGADRAARWRGHARCWRMPGRRTTSRAATGSRGGPPRPGSARPTAR